MSKIRKLLVASLLVTLGAFVLAGCAETIKQDELTGNIEKQFQEQTGTELTSIECDEVKAEKGAEISCKAVNENDMKLDITGEVTDNDKDDDKWGFDWKVSRVLAPGKAFEDAAAETVTREFDVPLESVKCPDGIEVKKGSEVKCEATATDGSTRVLNLTLTDAEGGFRVAVEKE